MAAQSRRIGLRVANLVAFIGVVVVNALAVTLPLNGRSTGELSDAYPNLFVPAGLTFSIWGVIYLLLGIYAVYQLVKHKPYVDRIGWLFVLSSVANMAWIFAWHYELVLLSFAVMLALSRSPHRHLPAPVHRPEHRQRRGEVDGARLLQRVPGVDHRGHGRQRHGAPRSTRAGGHSA